MFNQCFKGVFGQLFTSRQITNHSSSIKPGVVVDIFRCGGSPPFVSEDYRSPPHHFLCFVTKKQPYTQ